MAIEAGLDPRLIGVCDGAVEDVYSAIDAGVDKVVVTGSLGAGRSVMTRLAADVTPSVMELSGCDAAFICRMPISTWPPRRLRMA